MIDNDGVACGAAPVCAFCGTPGGLLYEGLSDQLFGAPGRWSIRQCQNAACASGWIDPKPLPAELGKLYQSYYTHESNEGERFSAGGRHAGLKRLLAALLPWQSAQFRSVLLYLEGLKPGRLLEMGCGSGLFLVEAMKHGWRVDGVDFDERAIAAANRHPGVTAWVGDLDHPSLEPGTYDALTMSHVIEHVPDPAHAFARCAALLKPGGRLVMITPNMAAQGRDIFGPDWRGLEIPRHLHLFTAATLKTLARSAGFSRIQAFSPIGGDETPYMVEASQEIARRAGRTPPSANVSKLRRSAAIGSLLGRVRGEFLVLVAHKS